MGSPFSLLYFSLSLLLLLQICIPVKKTQITVSQNRDGGEANDVFPPKFKLQKNKDCGKMNELNKILRRKKEKVVWIFES